MPSNFRDFTVLRWFASLNYERSSNITDDVIDIPLFTDTGSGTVNEATVILKAPRGRLVTNTNPIKVYDRIQITLTDLKGNKYDRYFEVDRIGLSQTKDSGTIMTLYCLGIEYHTQRIHFAKSYWFSNPHIPAREAGEVYELNRGTIQPQLTYHTESYDPANRRGNGAPLGIVGHYEYGKTPTPIYNVWLDLIDRLGGAVEDGGVDDFFEIGFDTPSATEIVMRLFSSGAHPENETPERDLIVVSKTNTLNASEVEGVIVTPEATRIHVIGDGKSGSLPLGHAQYRSGVFQFLFRPEWREEIDYPTNSKVLYDGRHYKAKKPSKGVTPSPTDATSLLSWSPIDMSDEFGDSVEYSEWTVDKARHWANCGTNPAAITVSAGVLTSTGAGCFDANLVLNDNSFFQTWVNDTSVGGVGGNQSYYKSGDEPRGFRFLNVGGADSIFTAGATDRFGKSYENAIIETRQSNNFRSPYREFIVKYNCTAANDGMLIIALNEGKTYRWNATDSTFDDISGQDLGNHAIHRWSRMENVPGVDRKPHETSTSNFPDVTKDGNTFAKNKNSAVAVTYRYDSAVTDRVLNREVYQSHGAWLNIRFPFPPITLGITDPVGGIYGGGEKSSATDRRNEPATLSISNLGFTPLGHRGFNQVDSAALMPLTTIGFALSLEKRAISTRDGAALIATTEPTLMRIAMGDTEDNVWIYDFEMPFSDGTWHQFEIPITGFDIYRGHKPRYANLRNLAELISPKEIDVQNIFESRNIAWMVIQDQTVYDEFGRFSPEGNVTDLDITALTSAFGGTSKLAIDDLHFKKALFVPSSQDTTRNVETTFIHREDIILWDQALAVARSEEEKSKFRHQEYNIVTTGESVFDIRFGDSFFFKNDAVVEASDNGDNHIKLVAKRIEYSISRPTAGAGGLRRAIKGVKRFYG